MLRELNPYFPESIRDCSAIVDFFNTTQNSIHRLKLSQLVSAISIVVAFQNFWIFNNLGKNLCYHWYKTCLVFSHDNGEEDCSTSKNVSLLGDGNALQAPAQMEKLNLLLDGFDPPYDRFALLWVKGTNLPQFAHSGFALFRTNIDYPHHPHKIALIGQKYYL